jgi:hypothetical protein
MVATKARAAGPEANAGVRSPVHGRHECHVGEAQARTGRGRGQAPLEPGRRSGQVRVDRSPGDGIERLGERRGGVRSRGDSEHQVGTGHRRLGAGVAHDAGGRRHPCRVVAVDLDVRAHGEVAGDQGAGLAETEDADPHHARHPTYSTPCACNAARSP